MVFDPTQYGPDVARILALDGNGRRLLPFFPNAVPNEEARQLLKTFQPKDLFPNQEEPEAPMAGLYLYFACFEEAHGLLQICETPEGELWHAILHRQERDSGNAAYWFRKAGPHPIYPKLALAAVKILAHYKHAEFNTGKWDPYAFAQFCDRAWKQPGSGQMKVAMEIQLAEWQILFDYCARLSE